MGASEALLFLPFLFTDNWQVFPHFSLMFPNSDKTAVSFGALYTVLKLEENFFRSL